ncbi:MAG: hypothetical protein JXL97_14930 [Bacteroidales bacterium]|nr:hypothetical protein [Bacteroidales bacterium]
MTKYIFGIKRLLLDIKLGLQYLRKLSRHFGFFRAIKEINKYSKDPEVQLNIFRTDM